MTEFNDTDPEIENADRREVMSAILKYSAVVGGATATVLTASEAVASGMGKHGGKKRRKHKKHKKR